MPRIRGDFPILSNTGLVYLDNAATSQKPVQVINAVKRFYETSNANIHRGVYRLSIESTMLYEEAHRVVAGFINARGMEEVVFARNTTELFNLLALSVSNMIREGDEIVTTVMEHHSSLLPWFRVAKRRNARLKLVKLDDGLQLDVGDLQEKITRRTRVVVVTHVSNVLGVENPIAEISSISRDYGALLVVDGAQSVPHMPVRVDELGADVLIFSAHKMLGPTGVGVMWARRDLLEELEPPTLGGDMVESVRLLSVNEGGEPELKVVYNELPWRFEAGTPNVAGAVGLAEAIRYLERVGMERILAHEQELTRYMVGRLAELGDGVKIVGPENPGRRLGIVSFVVRRGDGKVYDPFAVAGYLASKNIAVRAGFHCAQPLHDYLGLRKGTVRASVYLYNDRDDVDKMVDQLASLIALSRGG